MTALHWAAVLFGLAALGGATLAFLRIKGGNPPLLLAVGHGMIAAAALVTLAVGVIGGGVRGPAMIALVLLGLAAVGGFVMAAIHRSGRLIPLTLVFGHGTIAVAGFVALLVHLLR